MATDGERRSVLADVAVGLLFAALAGLVIGCFSDLGFAADAEWLGSTALLVVLTVLHALLLLGLLVDRRDHDGSSRRPETVAGVVPVVLAIVCGWAMLSGHAPYPAGARWPVLVATAVVGTVGAVLLWWSRRERASVRLPLVGLVAVVGSAAIWLPAGPVLDAVNIESTMTDRPLSAPLTGGFRHERLWVADGSSAGVSESGVYIADFGVVFSVDPVSGKRRWSYTDAAGSPDDDGVRPAGRGSRTVVADTTGDAVYVEGSDGLVVLDAVTGEVRGELDLPAPDAAGGKVLAYVDDDREGITVYRDSGERLWHADLPGGCDLGQMPNVDKVAIQSERVYLAAFCPDGAQVLSFRGVDGADRTVRSLSGTGSLQCLRLAAAGDVVAVRTCRARSSYQVNEVRLLDGSDLSVRWRSNLGVWAAVDDQAVGVDSRAVYVQVDEHAIQRLDIGDGGRLGAAKQVEVDGDPASGPDLAVSRGVVVVTGSRGIIGVR